MAAYKVLFSPESLLEIKDAVEYYNYKSKGLGSRFKSNFLAEVKAIKQNPLRNSVRYDEVRFGVIQKFPYAIHYTFNEVTKFIKIHAVLAFKQDDKTIWKIRF